MTAKTAKTYCCPVLDDAEKRRRTYELANDVCKAADELLRVADANVWEDIAVIAAARRYRKAVREHDTFVESC